MRCSTDGCHNPVSWYAKLKATDEAPRNLNLLLAVCMTCAMTALRLGGRAKAIRKDERMPEGYK